MNDFKSVLESIQKDHIYIQTHNFPDPDAIASAYGLSVLLNRFGVTTSICYKGKIERYSTNGLVDKLGIKMIDITDYEFETDDNEIIIVDSQKGNSNMTDIPGRYIACIDHHQSYISENRYRYRYSDIRPELGACATIIAEYYFENNIQMDKKVATALLYGIKTDTQRLSRGVSQRDMDIYQVLFKMCDKEIIDSLEHCNLQFEDLRAFATAINSIKVFDNVSFANTGRDCPEALIASISDFMLDLVEVDFSVVYSLKQDGIKLSIRSIGAIDAGAVTHLALEGIGGGGGHIEMAGGFVPFNKSEVDIIAVIDLIQERFLEGIGKLYR